MSNFKAQLQISVSIEYDLEALNESEALNIIANSLLSGNISLKCPNNVKVVNFDSGTVNLKKGCKKALIA